jgi:hypothetical protein
LALSFSRSVTPNANRRGAARKTPRQRQNRQPKPPPRGSTRRRRPPCDVKRSENQPSDPRARVIQNPVADFGQCMTFALEYDWVGITDRFVDVHRKALAGEQVAGT